MPIYQRDSMMAEIVSPSKR